MNLKFVFYLAILFLHTLCTNAQFSGKISYHFDYKTIGNTSLEEVVNNPIIDSVHYFIHAKAYQSKSFSKGEIVEEYVYDAVTKKMLFIMGNRPYYLYLQTDLEKFKQPLQIAVDSTKTQNIAGYSSYRVVNDKMREENYYSKDLQIDYKNFSEHYFMQWNQLLRHVKGSIPLKTITRYNAYVETKTANSIEFIAPSKMNFDVDQHKLQVAAYDNLDEVIDFPKLEGSNLWCYQAQVESKSNQLIDGKDYQLVLRLVVHPDRSISHVEVEESDYPYLDETAKRIIETCDLGFESGKINDIPVSTEIYYPINF